MSLLWNVVSGKHVLISLVFKFSKTDPFARWLQNIFCVEEQDWSFTATTGLLRQYKLH